MTTACRRPADECSSQVPGRGLEITFRDIAGNNLLDSPQRYNPDNVRFTDNQSGVAVDWSAVNTADTTLSLHCPHYYPFNCDGGYNQGTGLWGTLYIHLDSVDTDTLVVQRPVAEQFEYLYNGQWVAGRSIHDQNALTVEVRK